MLRRMYQLLIELTNHRLSSWLIRKFSMSKASAKMISSYARIFDINQEEMEKPLAEYQTLQDLFIRHLKPSARLINQAETAIVSPVDAKIEEYGTITASREITVKKKLYSIEEMVANQNVLEKYIEGQFIILYLSPRDYHRIHSPISGKITSQWEAGQKSYPVNQWGLKYGKDPLIKNFRKLTELKGTDGHVLMAKVGAMFINSIQMTCKKEQVERGEEVAYFTFGSTVILLFEKNTMEFLPSLQMGHHIKVGEPIGNIKK
ncbi:phosphatidylserine decarboxylase [Priestia megaterium]|nr:phosphatidylserine decarboxylase [Priestia megaterium]